MNELTLENARHLVLPDDNVLVIKYVGTFPGEAAVAYFRSIVEKQPVLATFSRLIDVRHWTGLAFDNDLLSVSPWIESIRTANALRPEKAIRTAFLGRPRAGVDYMLTSSATMSEWGFAPFYDAAAAWTYVTGDKALAPSVASFLRS